MDAVNSVAATSANRIVPFSCMPSTFMVSPPQEAAKLLKTPSSFFDMPEVSAVPDGTGSFPLDLLPSPGKPLPVSPESCLVARLFAPHPLLLEGFQVLLLVTSPGEAIGERHAHHGSFVACQQGFGLLLGSYRETMLSNQLHCTSNGDADLTTRAINPAVVVEQQIFPGMHFRHLQVAVIGLQAGRGKALHHLAQLLLLHYGIRCQILALASWLRTNLIPLVRGPIALDDRGVD